jgi:hypothetical protein
MDLPKGMCHMLSSSSSHHSPMPNLSKKKKKVNVFFLGCMASELKKSLRLQIQLKT